MESGRLVRWLGRLCLVPAALLGLAGTSNAQTTPKKPVIAIIPGMWGTSELMDGMRQWFVNQGWPSDRVVTWTDDTRMSGDLKAAGEKMGAAMEQFATGRKEPDVQFIVIAWSAAVIATRSYIQNDPNATKRVKMFFSLAGPNNGTATDNALFNFACKALSIACGQFETGSEFLRNLPQTLPASIYSVGLWSKCDVNGNPRETAKLPGANLNLETPACITHFDYPTDIGVRRTVYNIIQKQLNPGFSPAGKCYTAVNTKQSEKARIWPQGSSSAPTPTGSTSSQVGFALGSNDNTGEINQISQLRAVSENYYVADGTCAIPDF